MQSGVAASGGHGRRARAQGLECHPQRIDVGWRVFLECCQGLIELSQLTALDPTLFTRPSGGPLQFQNELERPTSPRCRLPPQFRDVWPSARSSPATSTASGSIWLTPFGDHGCRSVSLGRPLRRCWRCDHGRDMLSRPETTGVYGYMNRLDGVTICTVSAQSVSQCCSPFCT